MPLEKGKGKAVHSRNVEELMKSYLASGTIGTSHPATKEKAEEQANAIAYSKAREGKHRKKHRRGK